MRYPASEKLEIIRLVERSQRPAKAAIPLGTQAEALYALMESAGKDGLDFLAIIKLIDGSLSA